MKEYTLANWKPSASMATVKERAKMYQQIRQFFLARDVLEVETPLLASHTVSDPHIESIASDDGRWLQTSPEFAMKRLLAAGSGSIYQICKAFRQGDSGRRHNNEFTMLEWYRIGFDEYALIEEVAALLRLILDCDKGDTFSYAGLFSDVLGLDIETCDLAQLQKAVATQGINLNRPLEDRDSLLDLLFSFCIQPTLQQLSFVVDYPVSQAALAQTGDNQRGQIIARRFECFYQGLELANGYFELRDGDEYLKRHADDSLRRLQLQQEVHRLDTHFVAAMNAGLPECAGVALGLDRVLMLRLGVDDIANVLAFTQSHA